MSFDYKKNDKYRQNKKLHKKLHQHDVPKIMDCIFSNDHRTAHYCVTVKRKQEPTQMGKYENHEIFMRTCCTKNKDHLRKMKPL